MILRNVDWTIKRIYAYNFDKLLNIINDHEEFIICMSPWELFLIKKNAIKMQIL